MFECYPEAVPEPEPVKPVIKPTVPAVKPTVPVVKPTVPVTPSNPTQGSGTQSSFTNPTTDESTTTDISSGGNQPIVDPTPTPTPTPEPKPVV